MNIFKKLKLANKLIKTYAAVKSYLESTHLTKDVKDDITLIKEALKRLAGKIPAIRDLLELIF